MASSLSDPVDNLTEGIHKIKCKGCGCFLKYKRVKGNLIIYKCLSCNKCYSKRLNEELKKKFKNIFKFSNNGFNKFILLLKRLFYPYECMDDWERFIEAILLGKEEIYSNLNIEDITDADNMHVKRVCKYFQIKNLDEHLNLYLVSDVLLLADVFGNFRKMRLKTYELDPGKCISVHGL